MYEIAITRSLRKLEENPGRRNILIKSNRVTGTKLRQVQSQILKHSDSVTARSLNRFLFASPFDSNVATKRSVRAKIQSFGKKHSPHLRELVSTVESKGRKPRTGNTGVRSGKQRPFRGDSFCGTVLDRAIYRLCVTSLASLVLEVAAGKKTRRYPRARKESSLKLWWKIRAAVRLVGQGNRKGDPLELVRAARYTFRESVDSRVLRDSVPCTEQSAGQELPLFPSYPTHPPLTLLPPFLPSVVDSSRLQRRQKLRISTAFQETKSTFASGTTPSPAGFQRSLSRVLLYTLYIVYVNATRMVDRIWRCRCHVNDEIDYTTCSPHRFIVIFLLFFFFVSRFFREWSRRRRFFGDFMCVTTNDRCVHDISCQGYFIS